jgi:hypothetical protein
LKNLDKGWRVPDLDFLATILVGNGIEVVLELDMAIRVRLGLLPFCRFVHASRQLKKLLLFSLAEFLATRNSIFSLYP